MKRMSWLCWLGVMAWSLSGFEAMAIKAGDPVPDVSAPSTSGQNVNLRDLKAWTVLFFYPKAGTPGCTKQACGMRDAFTEMKNLGAVVLGVSTDDLAAQRKFKAEHQLPYDLLADNEKNVTKAFDALGMIGFAKRSTYIVNPEGIVTDVIDSVSVSTHDQDVLALLRQRMAAPPAE